MQIEAMRELTRKASGIFSPISADDSDILAILNHIKSNPIDAGLLAADQHADIWREQGPLLILALLPLMSLAFRRGVLLILPLLLLPYPPAADAMSWDELWQNRNQRGSLLFDQGAHDAAANLFDDAQWKASSLYRAGKYDQALQFWSEDDTGESQYNRGNALAKLGRYEDAIKAYQQVLNANPQHRDAGYNKRLIEELLQQQPQQQQNQDDKNSQESGDSSQDQNTSGSQQQGQSESDSSQADQQNEQNPTIQKPRSGQQDGTEVQASQARQPESSEESSPGTDSTEIGGEDDDEMSEQAANQWLRKIPDDPGGLLRRKFLYQYKSRGQSTPELNQW
jgi:Ca-activated chloride channel family protein